MITAFYASLVALALWITRHDKALAPIAGLLALSWFLDTAAYVVLGFHRAPLLYPMIDAAIGLQLLRWKSKTATWVFVGFVLGGFVHATAFVFNVTEDYTYRLALNLIFAAQCLAVAGGGYVRRGTRIRRNRRVHGFNMFNLRREIDSIRVDSMVGGENNVRIS